MIRDDAATRPDVVRPREATLPPASDRVSRASRITPMPSPEHPYELPDTASDIDDQCRILISLRTRSGRLVSTYAIGAGRSVVIARMLLHTRESAAALDDRGDLRLTLKPPPPEPPIDGHMLIDRPHRDDALASRMWAIVALVLAVGAMMYGFLHAHGAP